MHIPVSVFKTIGLLLAGALLAVLLMPVVVEIKPDPMDAAKVEERDLKEWKSRTDHSPLIPAQTWTMKGKKRGTWGSRFWIHSTSGSKVRYCHKGKSCTRLSAFEAHERTFRRAFVYGSHTNPKQKK